MKEQLITFETAKLAKEKGFDIQCHWYFTHKRKFPTSEDTYYPNQTSKPQNWNDDSNLKFYERFSTPTQSLLQKWLRETHQLHLEIQVQDYVETPKFYWDIFGNYKNNKMIRCIANSPREDYVSYEEALETGLQKALSYI